MKLIITGGLGFIGSNFIHYILKNYPDSQIVNMDKMTYAASMCNLKDIDVYSKKYVGLYGRIGDVCDIDNWHSVASQFLLNPDYIVNFAAESHNDNSILSSRVFMDSNFIGVHTMLEAARKYFPNARILQVSTDEVFGMLPLDTNEKFTESNLIKPSSPYAASKAAADLLVQAYVHTYKMNCVITRCSNNYGPRQHVEKLIPKAITNILQGKKVPIYAQGKNVRDWIYVEDHCRAIDIVMQNAKPGSVYNVGGDCEVSNIDLISFICRLLNVELEDVVEYVEDRPGHDLRYAINHQKLTGELKWVPLTSLDVGLARTVRWYKDRYGKGY